MDTFKKKVKNSFDQGADCYDKHSSIQKEISKNLLDLFFNELKENKEGFSLLELGCGTGFCGKKISENVGLTRIHFLDISNNMIKKSKIRFKNQNVFFLKNDFDFFDNFENYNLIVSNMSLHWSKDFLKLIKKILNSIKKKSIVLISFPNSRSFSSLKTKHHKLINDFPNEKKMEELLNNKKFNFTMKRMIHELEYKNIMFFFKSLKKIGANVSNNVFNISDLYSLRRDRDKVRVNFDISYFFIRKIRD